MKQKLTTYILLSAVVIIWGIIGYRFLSGKEENPLAIPLTLKERCNTAANSYLPKLNYRDPFFKEIIKASTNVPHTSVLPAPKKIETKESVNIECLGRINKGGEIFYLVNIQSEYYPVKQGDLIGRFRISRIDADSIYFVKGKWNYAAAIPQI